MNPDDLDLHAWPPHRFGGQQVRENAGVLVIHRPTGLAAVSVDERSQLRNKSKAMERLQLAYQATVAVRERALRAEYKDGES